MRVLVCGGRHYNDAGALNATLDAIRAEVGISAIIHGGATGADHLAGLWAHFYGLAPEVYEADWHEHGRAAGPIRNARMLTEGKPDLVVAAPGGRGTADMVSRARKAGIEVREIGSSSLAARSASGRLSHG